MESTIRTLLAAMLFASTTSIASADGIVDFNGLSVGTVVATTGGVTFTYVPHESEASGFPLIVSSGFASSSGARYLGVQDGHSEFFQPGDELNLALGSAVNRLDVTFIAPSGAPNGSFGLRSGATSVTSTSSNAVTLTTGDVAFTLHLTSPTSFVNATAFSNASSSPRFSIDDIVVPEPGAPALLTAGLVGLVWLGRRKAIPG